MSYPPVNGGVTYVASPIFYQKGDVMGLQLEPLRKHVQEILPLLKENFGKAHEEYMEGKIAKGALYYIQLRLDNATIIAFHDEPEKLNLEAAYRQAGSFLLDLNSYIKKDAPDRKPP